MATAKAFGAAKSGPPSHSIMRAMDEHAQLLVVGAPDDGGLAALRLQADLEVDVKQLAAGLLQVAQDLRRLRGCLPPAVAAQSCLQELSIAFCISLREGVL